MQQKLSKSTSKAGSSIPSLWRCFFAELPFQNDNVVAPLRRRLFGELPHESNNVVTSLQSERQGDFMQENAARTMVSAGRASNSADVVAGCIGSESKEACVSQTLIHDEEAQLCQNNCLALWKKWHPHALFNPPIDALSSEIKIHLLRQSSPTVQGNNKIMPDDDDVHRTTVCLPDLHPWRCFTFKEIADATENFHPGNLIGKGGYANVYKGTLSNGELIAVKKLNQDFVEHKEKGFLVEIGIMAHVCHPNTTPLVGFCLEDGLYLVYNFYPNGSLAGQLHGNKSKTFDWPLRYKVASGTARGLKYLHEQCRRRIIHRDIKASNILLDTDFKPQISDFGLAKWLPKEWTHHSVSPVEGTYGYLAPEYHMHGIVDEKTDVYSFGVLLLEIISGRRPIDDDCGCLVIWARPLLESRNIHALADPDLRGCYDNQEMLYMVIAADMCIRQSSISRPPMSKISGVGVAGCQRMMIKFEDQDAVKCEADLHCRYHYTRKRLA